MPTKLDYDDIYERGTGLLPHDCEILERRARAIGARTFLEIGARNGSSAMLFGTLAKEIGGRVWSLEPNPKRLWRINMDLYGVSDHVTAIKATSPWARLPAGAVVDFLFIDGMHKLRWVVADFWFWQPWVRKGGLIAFHDIFGAPRGQINGAVNLLAAECADVIREVERCDLRYAAATGGVVVFEKLTDADPPW